MEQNDKRYEELIRAFHLTWDAFPDTARLIDKGNHVLAVNQAAAGLTEGQVCAKTGAPESHRGCRKALALSMRTTQVDRPIENKLRTWVPLEEYPEVVVHFSVMLLECNQ